MSAQDIYKRKLLSLMDRAIAQGMDPQEIIEQTVETVLEKSLSSEFNYCCITEIVLSKFTRWYLSQHSPDLYDDEDECEFSCDCECEEFELPEVEETDKQTIH